ncbi:glycoside hydrolase family 43 protein [Isoptericola croceus]|uniref:glycoside hydrolase family 43 protein n=1 Tax=Isoptericola croceus TaxID=3031406 RepID=UPI0023F8653D|nr:glycoside hydrolase family 43 protein [Isoptericola croceus]
MTHTIARWRAATWLTAFLAALSLVAGWTVATSERASAADEQFTGYLMATFTGESSDGQQIYLAHSDDGLNWTDLNNGEIVLRSDVGTRGVRDPSLVRSPDGDRYWIIATDLCIGCGSNWSGAINNGSRNLVIWESTDLVNWSDPWLLDVAGAIPDGRNAWAPEAIWNAETGDYVLYWSTNVPHNGATKHRVYSARTSDFRTITTPQPFITPPGSEEIIDTQIVEVPNSVGGYRYYRANCVGRQITVEGSNSILGSWDHLGDLSHLNISNGAIPGSTVVEGPMWMKFNGEDRWALWLDQYATGRGYMPVTSTNLGDVTNFQRVSTYDVGANRKRHGSILNLTQAEENRVLGKWGTTAISRIQSYNFQDRYWRHANYGARIDTNVSPAQDAQWRIVPGLAGTDTVSFQSVNFPGYYLRHENYVLNLRQDDGSARFKADASFRAVDGLASPSWTSYQSYNFPDRYIRHYAYQLRIDTIGSATGQADATFRVVS